MRVVIFLRNTEDWSSMNLKKLMWGKTNLSCDKGEPTLRATTGLFAEGIHQFNALLSVNYFDFRAKLKEIALKSWGDLPVIEENDEHLLDQIGDDDIILPIDDDDWIHPDFKEIIKLEGFEEAGVLNQIYYEVLENRIAIDGYNSQTGRIYSGAIGFGSSQIVIRGDFLKRLSQKDQIAFLRRHESIRHISETKGYKLQWMNSKEYVTCYIKHFANHNTLTWCGGLDKEAIKNWLSNANPVDNQFKWTEPYVLDLKNFCENLRINDLKKPDFNWQLL